MRDNLFNNVKKGLVVQKSKGALTEKDRLYQKHKVMREMTESQKFKTHEDEETLYFDSGKAVVTVMRTNVTEQQKKWCEEIAIDTMMTYVHDEIFYLVVVLTSGDSIEVPFIKESKESFRILEEYKEGETLYIEMLFADSDTGEVFEAKYMDLNTITSQGIIDILKEQKKLDLTKEECLKRIEKFHSMPGLKKRMIQI